MPQEPRAPSQPSGSSSDQPFPLGEQIEARVAQLWFWEGFYSRHGIDLQHHFYPEHLQVTDLDLLAFDFNPQLSRSKYIGEVKSGTGKNAPRPLDRLIWLRGLRELVEAQSAELTTAYAPSGRVRALAQSLGIVAQSISDFERREREVVGQFADYGSHGVNALYLARSTHHICRQDHELERAFWFLRSTVWFLDPFTGAKQVIDLLRRLKRRWIPSSQDTEAPALRWLLAESASVLALNLVTIAGIGLTLERKQFYEIVKERLAEGAVPMHQMRQLSNSIDSYISGVLKMADIPADVRVSSIGAFLPEPPDYAEPLAEVAWRMGRVPHTARSLPRQFDLLVFERVAQWREMPANISRRIGLDRPDAARMRGIIAAFLRGCDASPDVLDTALTAPTSRQADSSSTQEEIAPSSGQSALFQDGAAHED